VVKSPCRSLAVRDESFAETVDDRGEHWRNVIGKIVTARFLEPQIIAIDFQDTDPWVR
jgi:hypothetical protein